MGHGNENELGKLTIKEMQRQANKTAREKGFHLMTNHINYYVQGDISPNKKPILILSWLAKITEEVGEAVTAVRKDDMENLAEEFADIVIRVADSCAELNIDLEEEIIKKMKINSGRPFMHGKNS